MCKTIDNSHRNYIDGLKGIACMGVAYSHFYGVFETSNQPYALPKSVVRIYWKNWLVGGLFNGSAWVMVFFAISGFLACNSVKKFIH